MKTSAGYWPLAALSGLLLVVSACSGEDDNEPTDCVFTPEHCRSEGFGDCEDCGLGVECSTEAWEFEPWENAYTGFPSTTECSGDGEDDTPFACMPGEFEDAYLEGWVEAGCQGAPP